MRLYNVTVEFSNPVLAENEEDAVNIARRESIDFMTDGEYTATQIHGAGVFPKNCLVFHANDSDITMEEALNMT